MSKYFSRRSDAYVVKDERPKVLVVTEGSTEMYWVKSLEKERGLFGVFDIKIENTEGHTPSSLVDYAARMEAKDEYDKVWVVFDRDSFGCFDNAIDNATSRKYRVAWSNESFELWYCLYFDLIETAQQRDWYNAKLKKILKVKSYDKDCKADPDLRTKILEAGGNELMAVARAKQLYENTKSANPWSVRNPTTMMYELYEYLVGIK